MGRSHTLPPHRESWVSQSGRQSRPARVLSSPSQPRFATVTTGYSSDWTSHRWAYPTGLEPFLQKMGTSLADRHEAEVRVDLFCLLPVAKRMPKELRAELVADGIVALEPPRRWGNGRCMRTTMRETREYEGGS